jgi:hypothetical protein
LDLDVIELNSNILNGTSIQFGFNNWIKIQLKRNEMQVDGEGIWKFIHAHLPCLFTCEWAKQF